MKEPDIFQEIMDRFYAKEEIEDEMLFYILDIMSDRIVESDSDSEWQFYEHFLDKLNKIWQYKQFDGISQEQSYLYGGIWGCLSMLSYVKKKKESSQKCHTLAVKYEKRSTYDFLNSVYKNPGVQNKKLAELCKVTPARISQIANDALKDGLISTRILGKEKCYYIRTLGESVFDMIQKQRDRLIMNKKLPGYNIALFSNEEDNFKMKFMKLISEINNLEGSNKVAIAVAYGNKRGENQLENMQYIERKNILCKQETSNLYSDSMSFWKPRREAGMIKLL